MEMVGEFLDSYIDEENEHVDVNIDSLVMKTKISIHDVVQCKNNYIRKGLILLEKIFDKTTLFHLLCLNPSMRM